jgi:cysteine synthase A
MVAAAEAAGDLEPGDTIVEPTSGNTGVGLALVGAAKGYDVHLVMPASRSPERRAVMRGYGATVELVEGDVSDARDRADELEAEGMVQMRQFQNEANPRAHYEATGHEILDQVEGREVDALVAGVGTGGTITGVGRRLREAFPDLRVVAVEPAENAVLSGDPPGDDDYQGMGPGFVSEILDVDLIDEVRTVPLPEAEAECRRLAREEGLFVGQSSGASNLAARRVAADLAGHDDPTPVDPGAGGERADPEGDGPLVVTVYWDSGERYVSTGLFDRD